MALVKIDALFREFPFLSEYLHRDGIEYFKVQRMDVDLLNTTVGVQKDYLDEVTRADYRCLILDKNGKMLLGVGSFEAPPGKTRPTYIRGRSVWYNPLTWSGVVLVQEPVKEIFKSELIKDAFYRLGARIDEAAFILMFGIWGKRSTLFIYKAPRGKTISEWISQEIEAARIEIASEFEAL